MNGNQIASLFCDQKGSHIANAFFDSEYVGEKSREKLFKVLQVSIFYTQNISLIILYLLKIGTNEQNYVHSEFFRIFGPFKARLQSVRYFVGRC